MGNGDYSQDLGWGVGLEQNPKVQESSAAPLFSQAWGRDSLRDWESSVPTAPFLPSACQRAALRNTGDGTKIKNSKFEGDEKEIKATFSAAALVQGPLFQRHLNLSTSSCWLEPRARTPQNIPLFEQRLCCADWNSNYSSYCLKSTVPVTFCGR